MRDGRRTVDTVDKVMATPVSATQLPSPTHNAASPGMTTGRSGPARGLERIGERVRRLRTERHLSQDRVSLSANIDQSGFSKFERGVRSIDEDALRRIASVLGVDFELMVRETDFGVQSGGEADSRKQH